MTIAENRFLLRYLPLRFSSISLLDRLTCGALMPNVGFGLGSLFVRCCRLLLCGGVCTCWIKLNPTGMMHCWCGYFKWDQGDGGGHYKHLANMGCSYLSGAIEKCIRACSKCADRYIDVASVVAHLCVYRETYFCWDPTGMTRHGMVTRFFQLQKLGLNSILKSKEYRRTISPKSVTGLLDLKRKHLDFVGLLEFHAISEDRDDPVHWLQLGTS
ncbi:hypothetical protein L1987_59320 [Smallanthus sonchifolius]|uniref:Uncharacterized protein n=1 Tax=Smallanthus sonchifolius TaxID=185202 RepID=A0ACB9D566_9ASTR|nr:hypothetical protein L1987_59320 [Smallanthus sonchifolius]